MVVLAQKVQIQVETKQQLENRRTKIKKYIAQQFDPFRSEGINTGQIDALYNLSEEEKLKLGLCRIQLIEGKLYGTHYPSPLYSGTSKLMYQTLVSSLDRIAKTHKINNVDFILFTVDNIPPLEGLDNILTNYPAFVNSKDCDSEIEKNKFLLPDPFILDNIKWSELIRKIKAASITYPWEQKNSEQIFWRGATTGGVYNLENYHNLPRLTLTMLSRSFPNLIDARFTHYSQFSHDTGGIYLYNILVRMFDNPGRIAEVDHLKYKYLISIDGNTAAWMRVPWILLSNSILLKQETAFSQLFYPGLEPYVNYIPLKQDLSDIFEKLNWLKEHDDLAKIIATNATNFCLECLMPENLDEYTVAILNEYHTLQRFKLTQPTLPKITHALTA